MAQSRTGSTWDINNWGKYINQFLPNTIKSIRQYKRINKKICRQKKSAPLMETDYFDIVAGMLQGDVLAPYFFLICLDYVLRISFDKMKDNGFKLTKEKSRRWPARTIMDADYANDIALLANKSAQTETLLHSVERADAGSISTHSRRNTCPLIKDVTPPHKRLVLWNK